MLRNKIYKHIDLQLAHLETLETLLCEKLQLFGVERNNSFYNIDERLLYIFFNDRQFLVTNVMQVKTTQKLTG